MEASLLPTKEVQTLCKQTVMAVIKRDAPECVQLRQEFSVRYLNSWIILLDGKGELLASCFGDIAGAGCNRRSVDAFPRSLVKFIRKMLKRTESVEELERQWKSQPQDTRLFEAFSRRLEEMFAYSKLRKHCQDAIENPALSKLQRDEFRIRAFAAWASDYSGGQFTRKVRAQFVREGERLLVELAGHPKGGELVYALFSRGYAHSFDVPGKSARAIARLEKASQPSEQTTPLKERIQELAKVREQWIAETTKALKEISDQDARDHIAASLGDSQAAIRHCSRPPYSELPEFREWVSDAERKIHREQEHPSATPSVLRV